MMAGMSCVYTKSLFPSLRFLYSLKLMAIIRCTIPIATETFSIFITWSKLSSDTFNTPTMPPRGANIGARTGCPSRWKPNISPVPSPAMLAAAPLAAISVPQVLIEPFPLCLSNMPSPNSKSPCPRSANMRP